MPITFNSFRPHARGQYVVDLLFFWGRDGFLVGEKFCVYGIFLPRSGPFCIASIRLSPVILRYATRCLVNPGLFHTTNVSGMPSGQEPLPDTLAIHIVIYIFTSSIKLPFYF